MEWHDVKAERATARAQREAERGAWLLYGRETFAPYLACRRSCASRSSRDGRSAVPHCSLLSVGKFAGSHRIHIHHPHSHVQ